MGQYFLFSHIVGNAGVAKQSAEEKNEIGEYADNANIVRQNKFSEDQIAEIDAHVESLPPAQKSLRTRKQIVDLPEGIHECITRAGSNNILYVT